MAPTVRKCILAGFLTLCLTGCHLIPLPSAPPASSAPTPSLPVIAPAEPDPVLPGSLCLAADPEDSFHPTLSTNRLNLLLAPLMYQSLFELDHTFTPQPILCSRYGVSPEGLVWTFTLKQGVTFSDGTPFTAQLAAQALELARTGTGYAGRFDNIDTIQADPDGRLVITLFQPNTALPSLLDIPIALGNGERPLGTGAYVLTQSGDGTLSLALRPDARSEDALPETHILLYPAPDTQSLIHGFDSGRISLVCCDPTGDNAPGFSAPRDELAAPTNTMVYLAFNTSKSSVFRSVEARRSVNAALDRDLLVHNAYSGCAAAAALPVHPDSPLYDSDLIASLIPEKSAREQMERIKLVGRKVTLIVNREDSCRVEAARLIADWLEQAGLTVTLRILAWSDYLTALQEGQFDLYLAQTTLTADFDLTDLVGTGGSLNYTRWANEETDNLLQNVLSAPASQRGSAAATLYTHLDQQAVVTPLLFRQNRVLTQWGQLTGPEPTRANLFYHPDRWVLNG